MIRETTEKLIWEKIDGTISSDDAARLEAILVGDAEARECLGELTRLSELLETPGEIDPPPALRQRIESAIDFDRYAHHRRGRAGVPWRAWLGFRWDVRLAAAAVAGLVVGIAGYHLFFAGPLSEGSLDKTRLVGTITSIDNGFDIDVGGVKGTIAFRERDDLAVSVIDITSERDVDVVLEYPGPSVHFEAASRNGGALPQISVSGNTISLNKLGDGKYVATFRREVQGSPLRVRIASEGEVLLDETVAPGGSH